MKLIDKEDLLLEIEAGLNSLDLVIEGKENLMAVKEAFELIFEIIQDAPEIGGNEDDFRRYS